MATQVRERTLSMPGRVDARLLRDLGLSFAAHILVVVIAILIAVFRPEPTRFEGDGPVVELAGIRGDSAEYKVGPLKTSGRTTKAPAPKPEPPKPEAKKPDPPKPEPPKPEAKPEPPKPEPPKPEVKKPEPPKPEPKPQALPEPKKPEPPKPEAKKPEPPKPEPKKPEPKPVEKPKPEVKKPEAKPEPKPEPKKPEPAKPAAKAPEAAKPAETPKPVPVPVPTQQGSEARTAQDGLPGADRADPNAGRSGGDTGGGGPGRRPPEFYAYYGHIVASVRAQWIWAGDTDSSLVAVIRFSILPDGRIAGARISEQSRSAQYDDSALQAVLATTLSPPPESVRADFEDMELVFRPGMLQ